MGCRRCWPGTETVPEERDPYALCLARFEAGWAPWSRRVGFAFALMELDNIRSWSCHLLLHVWKLPDHKLGHTLVGNFHG